jgi:hypothetical protein
MGIHMDTQQQTSGTNGKTHTLYDQLRINASRPRYTAAEIKRFRDMWRDGASTETLAAELRKTRPWLTDAGVTCFAQRFLRRIKRDVRPKQARRPARQGRVVALAPESFEVTVGAAGSDKLRFSATREQARAVVDLLAGF